MREGRALEGGSVPVDPARGGRRKARAGRAIEGLAEQLALDPELGAGFSHRHVEPARAARTVPLPEALDARLRALLCARGVERLYVHQARAVELALAGRDVLIATPTASGKTLGFVLPVLQRLLETRGAARSIFLYPTKALSQDQSAHLNGLIEALGEPWHSYTYDGDTPPSVRRTLRDHGHVLLTNPWMLHAGILPNHGKWSELFCGLETVVIDEVHTLGGVLGSSVANVLRRLVRIAAHYGSRPRFLLSSATLRDPLEFARALLGRDVEVVSEDGSPAGARHFAVYNPPVLDPVAGLRANALEEARRLAARVCGPSHQTIFFCNRRTSVEVLTRYLKESAPSFGLEPSEVRGYRGGYLPLLRREIEEGLRNGEVKVVVTTNALELGIDIGRLDVAVLVGYPGSQASFWQRAGRVGRRGEPSLTLLVARSDPLDQFLARHPDWLFSAARERLALDPDNLVILSEQLKCAAFELPFSSAELAGGSFGPPALSAGILDYLAEESGLLLRRGERWHWMADAYPAQDVSLDGGAPDNVLVLDAETSKALGEVDRAGSITAVHEGAIYQVEGEIWKIERFDYSNRRAYARSVESDYFTEAETDTELRVLRLERGAQRERTAGGDDYAALTGEVHVTTVATQYKKVRFYTRENVGAEDIHLPAEEVDTQAFALTLSEESAEQLGLAGAERGGAWRGVGELVRRVAPLFVRCRVQDLGLSCEVRSAHFGKPTIFLWDRVQGGVGLGERLFDEHRAVLGAALDVAARCACRDGCPACIGPTPQAGLGGKGTAIRILEHLAGGAAPAPFDPARIVRAAETAGALPSAASGSWART
jgi:DEAD/DEAH box helicase domain-containing protein